MSPAKAAPRTASAFDTGSNGTAGPTGGAGIRARLAPVKRAAERHYDGRKLALECDWAPNYPQRRRRGRALLALCHHDRAFEHHATLDDPGKGGVVGV